MNENYISQYYGHWAITEAAAAALIASAPTDIAGHVAAYEARVAAAPAPSLTYSYDVTADGVAVLSLAGTMMKFESSLGGGLSTAKARRTLRAIGNDAAVKAVVLRMDSPGGSVAGTADLADEVAALNGKKPVVAYAEDTTASAAYWVASQASKIMVNSTGAVGSIGVFTVVYDQSEAAAKEGVRAVVVKAGEFKGIGAPGAPVTDEQRAELQRQVDAYYNEFVGAVARGRGLSFGSAKALADGRVHLGKDAVVLGLADGVSTLEGAVSAALGLAQSRQEVRQTMADTMTPEVEARLRNEVAAQATADERKRVLAIIDLAAPMGLLNSAIGANGAIAAGLSVEQATIKLQAEKLDQYKAQAPQSPGPALDEPAKPKATESDEEKDDEELKAEWSANKDLRREFASADLYVAFAKAHAGGRVKIFGAKTPTE